jgi:hypothetical protein
VKILRFVSRDNIPESADVIASKGERAPVIGEGNVGSSNPLSRSTTDSERSPRGTPRTTPRPGHCPGLEQSKVPDSAREEARRLQRPHSIIDHHTER